MVTHEGASVLQQKQEREREREREREQRAESREMERHTGSAPRWDSPGMQLVTC